MTPDDIDLFVSHQANRRIIFAAAERLGVPDEKVVINIERFGNTTAATIPLALNDGDRGQAAEEGRPAADGVGRRRLHGGRDAAALGPEGVAPGAGRPRRPKIPAGRDNVILEVGGREARLTNLAKPFWPELGITKGDLLQYYLDVAPVLLPHIRDRAMVMRRYPDGAAGKSFFMKEAPSAAAARGCASARSITATARWCTSR